MGEVSGTIDESIRHALQNLLTFICKQAGSKENFKLGEDKKTISCRMPEIDLIKNMINKKITEFNQRIFKDGVGDFIDLQKPFLLISQHPVTTEYDKTAKHFLNTLKAIEKWECRVFFCGLMLMRVQEKSHKN